MSESGELLSDLRYEVDRAAEYLSTVQADRDGYKAERDRLRAVVDAVRDMAERVTDTNEDSSEYEEGNAVAWEYVRRQLSQLDVSPTMGDQYVTPEALGNPDWYRTPITGSEEGEG